MPNSRRGSKRPMSAAHRLLRRRLGLAPRACALMGASLVLAVGGISAYGLALPSLVAAREARAPHIARSGHGDLGATTGYVWAEVFGRTMFGDDTGASDAGDAGAAGKDEIELSDGTVIRLASVKSVTQLVQTSNTVKDIAAGAAAGGSGSGDKTSSGSNGNDNGSSGGSGTSSGSTGGNGTAGDNAGGGTTGGGSNSSSGGSGDDSGGLSATEEESIHSWLVTKYNMLDGYVSRANAAVATYGSTGDSSACDSLCGEMLPIRAEFGRQTFSPRSKWYGQFAKLWGCYTNLSQWVGHYGNDDVALTNFNNNLAAIAL